MKIEEVNKKIKELYGRITDDKPIFRVVWSADQYEDRFGEYNDFYGEIFLRTYVGVRRVLKYQEDPPSYVLERLIPNTSEDLPMTKLSYEPLYFFKNGDKVLSVEWWAVEMVIWTVLYGPKRAAELMNFRREKRNKRYEEDVLSFMENENPYIPGLLNDGAAVVNPWGKENFGGINDCKRSAV